MAFLTALGTVLGEHIATLIACGIVLGGAYIGLSPRGRLIAKGIRNYITSNASNNPKIAAGIFDEKIKELTETKRKTVEIAEKANGALTAELENEQKARREYEEYSKKARRLEGMGKHDDALVLARNAQKALNRAERYKENIPNLQCMAETAADRLREIEAKISDTEDRKQLAIENIKKGNIEKEISEELMELNISEIDTSLKEIEEFSNERKYIGVGARMAYENTDKKKVQDALESADYSDAEDFLKQLMESNE